MYEERLVYLLCGPLTSELRNHMGSLPFCHVSLSASKPSETISDSGVLIAGFYKEK